MNEISCPFCSTSQKLPQTAAGQTTRCKSCGKTFMVPTAPSAVSTAAHGRPPSVTPIKPSVPQASPAARPAPPLSGSRPTPAVISAGSAYRPAGPASAMPGGGAATRVPSLGAGGGLPVAVAVPTGTPQPALADGNLPSAESVESSGSSLSLLILGGAGCLVLGGLLLLVVIVRWTNRDRQSDRPTALDANSPTSTQIVRWTPASSRRSGWSSVSQGIAIDINSLAVDVHYVGYGEVRAKDAQNRVIVTDQKNYLQAYLKVKNLGSGPVQYSSWQGNAFTAGDQQVRATLVDDQRRSYPMQEFTHVAGLKGHTPRAILADKEEIEDVVVFAIPEGVDRRTIRHFRLELPAEAYGGSGVYRFEIPRQSIEGF
jgi:hypothetical protein